jgi:hypothetical protein
MRSLISIGALVYYRDGYKARRASGDCAGRSTGAAASTWSERLDQGSEQKEKRGTTGLAHHPRGTAGTLPTGSTAPAAPCERWLILGGCAPQPPQTGVIGVVTGRSGSHHTSTR